MGAVVTVKRLLALTLALALMLMPLSGCGFIEKTWSSLRDMLPLPAQGGDPQAETAQAETPPPEPEPPPVTPPPVAGQSGVYTDWSKLTAYDPPTEIFTRLKEERITELIPSKDYGRLLPFVGESLYAPEYNWQVGQKYGLVTTDGLIVLDAVCTNIWGASGYYDRANAGGADCLVLEKPVQNPNPADEWDEWINVQAIAAADGSWITPFEYREVFATEAGIVGIMDWEKNDARILGENGEVIFELSSLPFFDELDAGACYMLNEMSEGWVPLRFRDGFTRFVSLDGEILSGTETEARFESAGRFSEGLAAVRIGGYDGVINKKGEIVVEPQYDYIQSCTGGRMIAVKYPDDGGKNQTSYALDRQGNVLYEADGDLSYHESAGCYELYDFIGGTYTVFDKNMDVITVHGIPADSFVYDGSVAAACSEQGIWALADGREVLLPGAQYINWYADGFFCCSTLVGDVYIADADGRMVYELEMPQENYGMSLWYVRDTVTGELYFVLYDYMASKNSILDKNGEVIVTGYQWGEPVNGLFMCGDGVFGGYKNTENEWVFRVRTPGGDWD